MRVGFFWFFSSLPLFFVRIPLKKKPNKQKKKKETGHNTFKMSRKKLRSGFLHLPSSHFIFYLFPPVFKWFLLLPHTYCGVTLSFDSEVCVFWLSSTNKGLYFWCVKLLLGTPHC